MTKRSPRPKTMVDLRKVYRIVDCSHSYCHAFRYVLQRRSAAGVWPSIVGCDDEALLKTIRDLLITKEVLSEPELQRG